MEVMAVGTEEAMVADITTAAADTIKATGADITTEIGVVIIGIMEGMIIRILTITTIVGIIITPIIPTTMATPTITTMTVDLQGSTSHFSDR